MTQTPIDPAAVDLPPTEPVDITALLKMEPEPPAHLESRAHIGVGPTM